MRKRRINKRPKASRRQQKAAKRSAKKISMSISFGIAPDTKPTLASIAPDGQIIITDEQGKKVQPAYIERTVFYERATKPKVQSRGDSPTGLSSIGGLAELANFGSLCVVDTNTREIGGERISAGGVICVRIIPINKEYRIECERRFRVYEFRGIQGNPELLTILKVANDMRASGVSNVAFITDSALGSLDTINARSTPLYNEHLLPNGFHIIYASADSGSEISNRLIRICDRESSNYLRYLERGEIKNVAMIPLPEDNSVRYRLMDRTDIEWSSSPLKGLSVAPGTTVTLYGRKK